MRRMLPALFCLINLLGLLGSPLLGAPLLAAPEGRDATRPRPLRPTRGQPLTGTPAPPPAPAPGAREEPGAPRSPEESQPSSREERDPREQRRFDRRRADAVRARHRGRQLVAMGREIGDPVLLVTAAQLFDQSPAPRPLAVVSEGSPDAPLSALPPSLRDVPTRSLLLSEARAMAQVRKGELLEPTLTLIERVERTEVISRGSSLGPQQSCDALSPGVKLSFNIRYEGQEQAVVAIAGEGPGYLMIGVFDESGRSIASGPDRTLVSFYPTRRSTYRVSVLNNTNERIAFCLETN